MVQLAGITVDFLIVCVIVSCAGLIVLLPISIAGLGTREMVFITMFSLFGVDNAVALAASLLHFGLFFIIGSAIGSLALLALPAGTVSQGKQISSPIINDGREQEV